MAHKLWPSLLKREYSPLKRPYYMKLDIIQKSVAETG